MRTSFDIVLLLFTTFLVTGFKQFTTFFQNVYALEQLLKNARQNLNPEWASLTKRSQCVYSILMAQYILILIWLFFSLYLEINLSRRAQKDMRTKPVRILQVYSLLSVVLLLYIGISTLYIRFEWTGNVIRKMETFPQDVQQFLTSMDGLLDINYLFTIGTEVFIVFIIIQLWHEKTINEYRIRLEGDHTIDVSSLDGQSLQKYHFGSGACKIPEPLKCMLA